MPNRSLTRLERCLRVFTEVRPGEGRTGLLMLASVFLILCAYYFVKPARDGLLATSPVSSLSDVELKAYSSLGQSVLLLLLIPLWDRIAGAFARRFLITIVPIFFATNLIAFWALQPGLLVEHTDWLGLVFYLWVGVFNVFVVALFWSFAADLYDDEAGKRLFPMIALGATAGAALGSWLASRAVAAVGTYGLLLVAAALLVAPVFTLRACEVRDGGAKSAPAGDRDASGGFGLILRHRYLLAVAAMILVLNWVNTNGENLMFGAVEHVIQRQADAQSLSGEAASAFVRDQTTQFYGTLFFLVNLVALVLQAFAASRILAFGGVAAILFFLPVVALLSSTMMALFPVLAVIRTMKIAENATDYSINNTAKQVLWLPTTAAMKYKAKAAIDTIFVRAGDVLAAATAFVGVNRLDLPTGVLFGFNAALVVGWLAIASVVVREHGKLEAEQGSRAKAAA